MIERKQVFNVYPEGRIQVSAPARIHCGLLNTSGFGQQIDGGVGFSLESPSWIVEVEKGSPSLCGLQSPELQCAAEKAVSQLMKVLPLCSFKITVKSSIPLHIGLGAKTSLLMAIANAGCLLSGLKVSYSKLAMLIGRGGTSGIGVHSFANGGFIWDAGHAFPGDKSEIGPSSQCLAPPPRLIRRIFTDWLTVIHFRFCEWV